MVDEKKFTFQKACFNNRVIKVIPAKRLLEGGSTGQRLPH